MAKHSSDPRENDRVKEDLSKAVERAREIKRQQEESAKTSEKDDR